MANTLLVLFISASLIFLMDQLGKWLIVKIFQERIFLIRPFVQINLIINKHTILARRQVLLLVTWVLIVAWVLLLMNTEMLFQNKEAQIGLGSAIGGAASNLADQVKRGGIIDFIWIRRWSVFNLADVAIILGLCVAFWFR